MTEFSFHELSTFVKKKLKISSIIFLIATIILSGQTYT